MCIKNVDSERFIYKSTLFMCMKVDKVELLRINKGFGGNLISDSSIDFAIEMQDNKKIGVYKKLAYLLRAILVDHPFTDGNKRTATFIALSFAEESGRTVNTDLLEHHIVSISKQNIADISNIERRIRNAIR